MIGYKSFIKLLAWLVAIMKSLLIIASQKYYTVDVVIAWYVVNLGCYSSTRNCQKDRTNGSSLLLPLIRTKEENHKLLNVNTVDVTDRMKITQLNGRRLEDRNA